jgi:hypothetical protein
LVLPCSHFHGQLIGPSLLLSVNTLPRVLMTRGCVNVWTQIRCFFYFLPHRVVRSQTLSGTRALLRHHCLRLHTIIYVLPLVVLTSTSTTFPREYIPLDMGIMHTRAVGTCLLPFVRGTRDCELLPRFHRSPPVFTGIRNTTRWRV